MTKGHTVDPNEALAQLRQAVTDLQDESIEQDAIDRVVEQFEALDTWLSQGGFKPLAWENFGGLKTPEEKP